MAHLHAITGEPCLEVGRQRPLLAAERRAAAGDIERQPIGRQHRDQRGIAVTSVGDAFEQHEIGGGIGIDHGKLGQPRARIGQRQPGGET